MEKETNEKKTESINLMVSKSTKDNLKQKSKQLGLTLTSFFEKVANEPIVFLDRNTLSLLKVLNFKPS